MDSPRKKTPVSKLAFLGIALALLAGFLALSSPPDSHGHGRLAQFVGRFHPVLVHLPIGLLLLVPILELAGLFGRRSELRTAAGFVLGLAAASSLIAALDGWLLGWSGGYGGPLVLRHMWGGVALSAVLVAAAILRKSQPPGRIGHVLLYWPVLLGSVALLFWTGHQGGQLSHGDTFLSEFMPATLRSWLRVPEPPKPKPAPASRTARPTFYSARIAPILDRSCVSCHNPRKIKGGLRLDTYEQLMRGGDDGSVVEPWYPKDSELLRRVTLPSDDDDFMPNNGKNPLTEAEIRLIERWIAAGASPTEPADANPAQ